MNEPQLVPALSQAALPAANANSTVGVVKGFGYIAVFMSLTLALVHTSFGMTSMITDQVLAWIGGHANSALGAKHDQQADNIFVGGVSHGRTAVQANLTKDKGGGDKKPDEIDNPPPPPPVR